MLYYAPPEGGCTPQGGCTAQNPRVWVRMESYDDGARLQAFLPKKRNDTYCRLLLVDWATPS